MFYIDSHCDTLSKALDLEKDLYVNDLQFSFDKMSKLGGGIQVLACFVDTEFLNYENSGFIRCNNILNKLKQYEKNSSSNVVIKNRKDLINAVNKSESRVILSIENGSAISGKLENIDYFHDNGIRMMSLMWNDDNELGCGAKTKEDNGLTKFGIECVNRLNDLDIIVDVSHSSEKTFWDIISVSNKPVVASHSNVYEICNHFRNLKDEQIKAIAKNNGMIGVCFYSDFLNAKKRADVKDIVEHIKYIKKLVGIDYVGLGSDFDGMSVEETAKGVEDVSKINNIIVELKLQGFSDKEITKIMWENWNNLLERSLTDS